MVDLKQTQDVDRLLSYLEAQWSEVPEIADSWDSEMDGIDKEVFQLEWSIKEDNLVLLEAQVARGNLSNEQYRRYQDLKRLIRQERPVLERLFAAE